MDTCIRQQQGYLLVGAAILVGIFGVVVLSLNRSTATDAHQTYLRSEGLEAHYIAESGLQRGVYSLLTSVAADKLSCATITGNVAMTNVAIGSGTYTVTAAAQPSGACLVQSTGYVPNSTSPVASRTVSMEVTTSVAGLAVANVSVGRNATAGWTGSSWVEMAEWPSMPAKSLHDIYINASNTDGWVVGDKSGNALIGRWNGSTLEQFTPTTSLASQNLYGVHCANNSYCMVVGSSRTVGIWNGTSWTAPTLPSIKTNTSLYSVSCPGTNNCYVVGTAENKDLLILRWNGSTWTRETIAGETTDVDLEGVHCSSPTFCWAVGVGARFVRKTGAGWAEFSPGSIPAVNYHDVHCPADNNCWAVGDADSGNATLVRWNGTSWTRSLPTTTVNQTLNGVHCDTTTHCVAVGASNAFLEYNGTSWSTASGPSAPSGWTYNAVAITTASGGGSGAVGASKWKEQVQ